MFAPADFLNLDRTAHPKLFENQNYVWDALKQIASYLQFRLKPAILGELMGKPFISNHIFIGRGTVVGARSLVLSNTQPASIYVGSPARRVGAREKVEL